ncbi:hypothetical protein QOZ80_4BG0330070 [Eleusine coracana subsp. coracana]|nr:hypothetical protein QOZ80_4BG0330070 [Eleusine coracana subsp. coracana]
MESYRKLGKIQFIAGREGFTLCRHNEYGIINLKKKVMVKCTYLYHELMLRLDARKATEMYIILKEKGMFSWPAYKEHRESIQKSFAILRHALGRYKDRGVKAGFFQYACSSGPTLSSCDEPLAHYATKRSLEKNKTASPDERSVCH